MCVSATTRDERWVGVDLPVWVAQALYDHTGTMPFAPESWSNELRAVLSEALHGVAATNRSDAEKRAHS